MTANDLSHAGVKGMRWGIRTRSTHERALGARKKAELAKLDIQKLDQKTRLQKEKAALNPEDKLAKKHFKLESKAVRAEQRARRLETISKYSVPKPKDSQSNKPTNNRNNNDNRNFQPRNDRTQRYEKVGDKVANTPYRPENARRNEGIFKRAVSSAVVNAAGAVGTKSGEAFGDYAGAQLVTYMAKQTGKRTAKAAWEKAKAMGGYAVVSGIPATGARWSDKVSEELLHYGVKGMEWGTRNGEKALKEFDAAYAQMTPAQKAEFNKKLQDGTGMSVTDVRTDMMTNGRMSPMMKLKYMGVMKKVIQKNFNLSDADMEELKSIPRAKPESPVKTKLRNIKTKYQLATMPKAKELGGVGGGALFTRAKDGGPGYEKKYPGGDGTNEKDYELRSKKESNAAAQNYRAKPKPPKAQVTHKPKNNSDNIYPYLVSTPEIDQPFYNKKKVKHTSALDPNSLYHAGVRGMRWGIRNERSRSASGANRAAKLESKAKTFDNKAMISDKDQARSGKYAAYNSEKYRRKADKLRAKAVSSIDKPSAKATYAKSVKKTSTWSDSNFNKARVKRTASNVALGGMAATGAVAASILPMSALLLAL